MHSQSLNKKIIKTAVLPALLCVIFSINALAQAPELDLSLSWSEGTVSLSWDAPANSSGTVTYSVYRSFGYGKLSTTTATGDKRIAVLADKTTYVDGKNSWVAGTHEYLVKAVDEDPGSAPLFTNVMINHYMLNKIQIRDGEGLNWGFGQKWFFKIGLQDDTILRAEVYDTNDYFDEFDADGFLVSPREHSVQIQNPVKVLEDSTHWPIYMDRTVEVEWDWKDESGVLQPIGTYYVFFEVFDMDLNKRDAKYIKVVLNEPRFQDLSTGAIDQESNSADISFKSNSDADVTVLICKPDTSFIVATSSGALEYTYNGEDFLYKYGVGAPVPIDSENNPDPNSIVKGITKFKLAGNVQLDWNGTNQAGVPVTERGVYRIAVTGLNVNDMRTAPNFLTAELMVDVDPVEHWGDGPPTVQSISPEANAKLTIALDLVTVTLAHPTNVDPENSLIRVIDPDGEQYFHGHYAVGAWSGTNKERILTLTFNEPLSKNGTYSVWITAVGYPDSKHVHKREFSIYIPVTQEKTFEEQVKAYPQPARTGIVNIAYNLIATSDVNLEIFNLMQEQVYEEQFSSLAAGDHVIQWDLNRTNGSKVAPGVYFYRLTADSGTEKVKALKRLVVIK